MTDDIKQVFVVRKDLNMRKGKIAAQVSHACLNSFINQTKLNPIDTNSLALDPNTNEKINKWIHGDYKKIVLQCETLDDLDRISLSCLTGGIYVERVWDLGLTEFNGVNTLTCIAIGPDFSSLIDPFTKDLKLM